MDEHPFGDAPLDTLLRCPNCGYKIAAVVAKWLTPRCKCPGCHKTRVDEFTDKESA